MVFPDRLAADDAGSRWWNPAAEMQAIDRTHRLGQFKPIYATRFIIEDTVEERIIKLQASRAAVPATRGHVHPPLRVGMFAF